MGIALPESAKRILDDRNIAHIATVMKDGSPQVTPVWLFRDGDQIMVSSGAERLKTRNIKRDPRIALSIAPLDRPFPPLVIRGRVAAIITGQPALEGFFAVHRKYGNDNPPSPSDERVLYRIEVTRCTMQ